jgi:trehalose 6-phosphate synthase/phosphatase
MSTAQRGGLQAALAAQRLSPVFLSRNDVKGFYEDVSNSVLWPVLHYRIDQMPMNPTGWPTYRKVNEAFARTAIEAYRPGDVIWIHDYHLMLAPELIRRTLPQARIGYFLHIPFPPPDVFRVIPWRDEILQGLLAADLIGFHTPSDAEHFLDSCRRILRLDTTRDGVVQGDRLARVQAFPLGIDTSFWSELAAEKQVAEHAAGIRSEAAGRKLLVSIDRLDYTKGILHRLTAIETMFQQDPELAASTRLLQVVFPSRERIEYYAGLKRRVDEQVGRINGRYGSLWDAPIRVLNRNLPPADVAALYAAADVMLVTPLRDGMNLVAKEFVACRTHEDGVLVLSEFAGAAGELTDALQVNPYNVEEMADRFRQALQMGIRDQRNRMRNLRTRVLRNDARAWANTFIDTLQVGNGAAQQSA